MLSFSREILSPARYVLESPLGISYGSFSQEERAIEYKDALWRLRGLTCIVVDTHKGASK